MTTSPTPDDHAGTRQPVPRLRLVRPPQVVVVRTASGTARALLLAVRGRRAYLQVHRGVGDEVLRWVPDGDLVPRVPDAPSVPAG